MLNLVSGQIHLRFLHLSELCLFISQGWVGYLCNIDLIYYGVNSVILYKLRYYSINITLESL